MNYTEVEEKLLAAGGIVGKEKYVIDGTLERKITIEYDHSRVFAFNCCAFCAEAVTLEQTEYGNIFINFSVKNSVTGLYLTCGYVNAASVEELRIA